MRFLFLLVATGSLLVGLLATPASGQGNAISPSLSVSPPLIRQTVQPGKSLTVKVTIQNLGADPIPLGVSKMNISRISDQGAPEFTPQITPRSANDWLVVARSDLIVEPGKKQEIDIIITPPAGTAPGGYNAVLVFQAKLPSYYFDIDANARILPALTTSFLLSVDPTNAGTIEPIAIKNFQIPKVVLSVPVPLITELTNPSNYFVFADGDLTLNPTFGADKKVTELTGSVLMPESSRKYISAYSGRLLPGLYDATFQVKQGDQVIVASARFFALPWPFLIGTLAALVVLFFLLARRRLARAWQILAGRDQPPTRPQSHRPVLR